MTLPGERVGKLELRTFCKVWEVVQLQAVDSEWKKKELQYQEGFCLNRKHMMNSERKGHNQG